MPWRCRQKHLPPRHGIKNYVRAMLSPHAGNEMRLLDLSSFARLASVSPHARHAPAPDGEQLRSLTELLFDEVGSADVGTAASQV
jgi:hypothetical protein